MRADTHQQRAANLRALCDQHGVTGLAQRLGYAGPGYLHQLIAAKRLRVCGEDTARYIEHTLGLSRGWLDEDQQS